MELDCMEERELKYLESRYYVGISGKGMTAFPTIRTKRPNIKQNTRTSITDITNQYFRKLLKEFKNSPYLDYNKKQVYNEPTEA